MPGVYLEYIKAGKFVVPVELTFQTETIKVQDDVRGLVNTSKWIERHNWKEIKAMLKPAVEACLKYNETPLESIPKSHHISYGENVSLGYLIVANKITPPFLGILDTKKNCWTDDEDDEDELLGITDHVRMQDHGAEFTEFIPTKTAIRVCVVRKSIVSIDDARRIRKELGVRSDDVRNYFSSATHLSNEPGPSSQTHNQYPENNQQTEREAPVQNGPEPPRPRTGGNNSDSEVENIPRTFGDPDEIRDAVRLYTHVMRDHDVDSGEDPDDDQSLPDIEPYPPKRKKAPRSRKKSASYSPSKSKRLTHNNILAISQEGQGQASFSEEDTTHKRGNKKSKRKRTVAVVEPMRTLANGQKSFEHAIGALTTEKRRKARPGSSHGTDKLHSSGGRSKQPPAIDIIAPDDDRLTITNPPEPIPIITPTTSKSHTIEHEGDEKKKLKRKKKRKRRNIDDDPHKWERLTPSPFEDESDESSEDHYMHHDVESDLEMPVLTKMVDSEEEGEPKSQTEQPQSEAIAQTNDEKSETERPSLTEQQTTASIVEINQISTNAVVEKQPEREENCPINTNLEQTKNMNEESDTPKASTPTPSTKSRKQRENSESHPKASNSSKIDQPSQDRNSVLTIAGKFVEVFKNLKGKQSPVPSVVGSATVKPAETLPIPDKPQTSDKLLVPSSTFTPKRPVKVKRRKSINRIKANDVSRGLGTAATTKNNHKTGNSPARSKVKTTETQTQDKSNLKSGDPQTKAKGRSNETQTHDKVNLKIEDSQMKAKGKTNNTQTQEKLNLKTVNSQAKPKTSETHTQDKDNLKIGDSQTKPKGKTSGTQTQDRLRTMGAQTPDMTKSVEVQSLKSKILGAQIHDKPKIIETKLLNKPKVVKLKMQGKPTMGDAQTQTDDLLIVAQFDKKSSSPSRAIVKMSRSCEVSSEEEFSELPHRTGTPIGLLESNRHLNATPIHHPALGSPGRDVFDDDGLFSFESPTVPALSFDQTSAISHKSTNEILASSQSHPSSFSDNSLDETQLSPNSPQPGCSHWVATCRSKPVTPPPAALMPPPISRPPRTPKKSFDRMDMLSLSCSQDLFDEPTLPNPLEEAGLDTMPVGAEAGAWNVSSETSANSGSLYQLMTQPDVFKAGMALLEKVSTSREISSDLERKLGLAGNKKVATQSEEDDSDKSKALVPMSAVRRKRDVSPDICELVPDKRLKLVVPARRSRRDTFDEPSGNASTDIDGTVALRRSTDDETSDIETGSDAVLMEYLTRCESGSKYEPRGDEFDLSQRSYCMLNVVPQYDLKSRLYKIHSKAIRETTVPQLVEHFKAIKPELFGIFQGRIASLRHKIFLRGLAGRADLRSLIVAVPFTGEQGTILITLIYDHIVPDPAVRCQYIEYVNYVLVPETFIRIYSKINNISFDLAETEMRFRACYEGEVSEIAQLQPLE